LLNIPEISHKQS